MWGGAPSGNGMLDGFFDAIRVDEIFFLLLGKNA
jgi:hypothetical protein